LWTAARPCCLTAPEVPNASATSPASTRTLKPLASRNDPAGKAFPYRPLTEADVGCPHPVQGVRQEVAANDYALDYIWPELAASGCTSSPAGISFWPKALIMRVRAQQMLLHGTQQT
jgi:hypothetical protein